MKTITYTTHGTCARYIEVSGENGVLTDVKFYGGCNGNLQGISRLVEGKHIDEVETLLAGVRCKGNTSCPDQLACALKKALAEE